MHPCVLCLNVAIHLGVKFTAAAIKSVSAPCLMHFFICPCFVLSVRLYMPVSALLCLMFMDILLHNSVIAKDKKNII